MRFRPSFPCPRRTCDKQEQVQGLLQRAGWVIRHGAVVTPAGWHRTTRAVRYIQRRSRTSCIRIPTRVRPCSWRAGQPEFPLVGAAGQRRPRSHNDSVTRLSDRRSVDRVVRLGRHKSEAVCRRAARRTPGVVAVAVQCSALESFAGGRATLLAYQHNGRMFGGARGQKSLLHIRFLDWDGWLAARMGVGDAGASGDDSSTRRGPS